MSEDEDKLMRILQNLDADELESIIWSLVDITGVEPALEKAEDIAWSHTFLTPEHVKDIIAGIVDIEPYDMRRFPDPYSLGSNIYDDSVGMVYLACSIRDALEDDIVQMVNLGMTEEANLCLKAMAEGLLCVDSYFTRDQCNTIDWYCSLIRHCIEDGHPETLFDTAEGDLNGTVLDTWGSGWRRRHRSSRSR